MSESPLHADDSRDEWDDEAVEEVDEAADDAAEADEATEAEASVADTDDADDAPVGAGVDEDGDILPDVDPVEEFKRQLRGQLGEWYVIHSYAGYENRVKQNIESRTGSLNMEDYIFQVEVPTHTVTEFKGGKKTPIKERVLPGYVLVRMELTDESWAAVRNTPGVTGFVGLSNKPSPLNLDEVAKLLAPEPTEEVKKAASQVGRLDRRVRDRRVGHRHGRPVRHAPGLGQRDQPRVAEAQGAGVDLRPRDPGGALVQPGLEDLRLSPTIRRSVEPLLREGRLADMFPSVSPGKSPVTRRRNLTGPGARKDHASQEEGSRRW